MKSITIRYLVSPTRQYLGVQLLQKLSAAFQQELAACFPNATATIDAAWSHTDETRYIIRAETAKGVALVGEGFCGLVWLHGDNTVTRETLDAMADRIQQADHTAWTRAISRRALWQDEQQR